LYFKAILDFIPKFFSASPLGQLGLIVMQDKRAKRIVSLGGSPIQFKTELEKIYEEGLKCSGQCSLINAVETASNMLNAIGGTHAKREIIFIVGALTTIDSSSPFKTIDQSKLLLYHEI
jgi:hypothetical protein